MFRCVSRYPLDPEPSSSVAGCVDQKKMSDVPNSLKTSSSKGRQKPQVPDASWFGSIASRIRNFLGRNDEEERKAIERQSDVAWRDSLHKFAEARKTETNHDQHSHIDNSLSGLFGPSEVERSEIDVDESDVDESDVDESEVDESEKEDEIENLDALYEEEYDHDAENEYDQDLEHEFDDVSGGQDDQRQENEEIEIDGLDEIDHNNDDYDEDAVDYANDVHVTDDVENNAQAADDDHMEIDIDMADDDAYAINENGSDSSLPPVNLSDHPCEEFSSDASVEESHSNELLEKPAPSAPADVAMVVESMDHANKESVVSDAKSVETSINSVQPAQPLPHIDSKQTPGPSANNSLKDSAKIEKPHSGTAVPAFGQNKAKLVGFTFGPGDSTDLWHSTEATELPRKDSETIDDTHVQNQLAQKLAEKERIRPDPESKQNSPSDSHEPLHNPRWNLFSVGFSVTPETEQSTAPPSFEQDSSASMFFAEEFNKLAEIDHSMFTEKAHRYVSESPLFSGRAPAPKPPVHDSMPPPPPKENVEESIQKHVGAAQSLFAGSSLFGGKRKREPESDVDTGEAETESKVSESERETSRESSPEAREAPRSRPSSRSKTIPGRHRPMTRSALRALEAEKNGEQKEEIKEPPRKRRLRKRS